MTAVIVASRVRVSGSAPITGEWPVYHARRADPLTAWARDVSRLTEWDAERVRPSEHGYVYALRSRRGKRQVRFHVAVETTLTGIVSARVSL